METYFIMSDHFRCAISCLSPTPVDIKKISIGKPICETVHTKIPAFLQQVEALRYSYISSKRMILVLGHLILFPTKADLQERTRVFVSYSLTIDILIKT